MTFLDVMTLTIMLFVLVVAVAFTIWLAGLPGRLAQQRNHPQADAIAALGWLSLLTFFATWPLALVWAYARPANVTVTSDNTTSGVQR